MTRKLVLVVSDIVVVVVVAVVASDFEIKVGSLFSLILACVCVCVWL